MPFWFLALAWLMNLASRFVDARSSDINQRVCVFFVVQFIIYYCGAWKKGNYLQLIAPCMKWRIVFDRRCGNVPLAKGASSALPPPLKIVLRSISFGGARQKVDFEG